MTISLHNYNTWTNKFCRLFNSNNQKITPGQPDNCAASVMHRIVDEEKTLAKTALDDPWRRYPVAVIGVGAFNCAELALDGASVFAPCVAITDLLIGIGLIGGLFNLREGALALEEGIHALKVNDLKLAARLFLQGTLLCALGTAMFILSVARIAAISSILTFFSINPYVLPVLFFSLSIFLFLETMSRLGPVLQRKDLGSQLELSKLRSMLQDPQGLEAATKWVHSKIKECIDARPAENERVIQNTFNKYKAGIGFTAAKETFQLFEMILHKKKKMEILKQIERVESKISAWNRTLYLKMLSVLLTTSGFVAGMAATAVKSEPIDGAQNFAMSAAETVPLYLDICKPFEREIPIVICRKISEHSYCEAKKTA